MIKVTICAVLLILCSASPSLGAVVELTNGQRVEGTFRQANPETVTVEVGGQTLTFEAAKVRAIYFVTAPPPATQASLSGEALRSLKGIQSLTRTGVSYREYAPRVNDAQIMVDRFLEEDKSAAPEFRASIQLAMQFYKLSSMVWNMKVTHARNEGIIARDPTLQQCPALVPIIEEARRDKFVISEEARIAIHLGSHLDEFWHCASEKIAEAERALKAMPTGGQQ